MVGVHACNDAARVEATLRALAENTGEAIEAVVLGDSALAQPPGAAEAFNRLLREHDADLYVFLESGALVGPQWLTRLCAALDADPKHGIAGPTTNMAWSVQGEFRGRPAGRPFNPICPGTIPSVRGTLAPRHLRHAPARQPRSARQ